ncbi:hypothetical protein [Virgibacillus dokdonensis]|nr:hypothetical protein [Virgibacillus dokdonensis]
MGAHKLAWAAGAALAIAKQIDKRDKYPNNGWIDIAFWELLS